MTFEQFRPVAPDLSKLTPWTNVDEDEWGRLLVVRKEEETAEVVKVGLHEVVKVGLHRLPEGWYCTVDYQPPQKMYVRFVGWDRVAVPRQFVSGFFSDEEKFERADAFVRSVFLPPGAPNTAQTWRPSGLCLLVGAPGVGKSSFLLNMARPGVHLAQISQLGLGGGTLEVAFYKELLQSVEKEVGPWTILIDDFGAFAAPQEIQAIVGQMADLVGRRNVTFVLCTQSVAVLNLPTFRAHPEDVFVLRPGKDGLEAVSLTELHDPYWLAQSRLGTLHEQGRLVDSVESAS